MMRLAFGANWGKPVMTISSSLPSSQSPSESSGAWACCRATLGLLIPNRFVVAADFLREVVGRQVAAENRRSPLNAKGFPGRRIDFQRL